VNGATLDAAASTSGGPTANITCFNPQTIHTATRLPHR